MAKPRGTKMDIDVNAPEFRANMQRLADLRRMKRAERTDVEDAEWRVLLVMEKLGKTQRKFDRLTGRKSTTGKKRG